MRCTFRPIRFGTENRFSRIRDHRCRNKFHTSYTLSFWLSRNQAKYEAFQGKLSKFSTYRCLERGNDVKHKKDRTTEKDISVEEQYSRKTPLEHVLLRPGMYVGPNERVSPNPCWVLEAPPDNPSHELRKLAIVDPMQIQAAIDGHESLRIVKREYALVPALVKIFDEILVNASDNRLRYPDSCTRIDVLIDQGSESRDPFILVFNDGKGIPVQIHGHEQIYVPELVFGHLLTGSNFDDSEERLTGGRHGYGAKLANIFSKSFTVETLDSQRHLKYRQTWMKNMSEICMPEIISVDPELHDYTCISFVPDLHRLTGDRNETTISSEDYALMCRRVVDIAGCSAGSLTVTLNGKNVSQASFDGYSLLYRDHDSPPICFHSINERWKVGVGLSKSGSFEAVSFVNGMFTSRGGTHVNAIVQQLTRSIQEYFVNMETQLADFVSLASIRRKLFVWCDAQIINPTFDSQMKEFLASNPNTFGSSYVLSDQFIQQILNCEENGGPGIIKEILRSAKDRERGFLLKDISRNKSKRQIQLSIPKLEDAHYAGTNKGRDCTIILTEGDSAKALAVAGLEVIGRENFGVFPLRGKLLNVRDVSVVQLAKNTEIKALCAIIGLDFEKEYKTVVERCQLRYGHVMLMTDQDNDGSHIKGLVINFFRHFWPKLLQPPIDHDKKNPVRSSFISCFVTPLLKATKKGAKTQKSFYSMVEYNEWREKLRPEDLKKWNVKYYKGLGTNTPAEAKEYFTAFDYHVKPFLWNSEIDGELLDMVFSKERAADRRDWILGKYDEAVTLNVNPDQENVLSYEDFINKEMIHFSHADNIRSIPSAIDGFKPSQRKVLFACFKRKLSSEVKVAQLSGYCAEHTCYHHGEVSLQSTIVGMAQDFVGANNINLLVPSGQFGTRLAGGTDAASPRYIFTHLHPIARYLFPEKDDTLLSYREEDGQKIEPDFYCPVIPLLLINGSQGIGTGWSTFIPPHNPHDLVDYMLAKLNNMKELPLIRPFARGFHGRIEPNRNGAGFVTYGRVSKVSQSSIHIDELPLRLWTNKYKDHLINLRNKGLISGFKENNSTTKVSFTVTLSPNRLSKLDESGLESLFRLKSFLPTGNMYAFGANHLIKKFETAEDIIEEFFPVRNALYEDRKSVIESELNYSARLLENKARFIQSVANRDFDLMSGQRTKQEIINALTSLGFSSSTELRVIRNNNSLCRRRACLFDDAELCSMDKSCEDDFDYLLNIPLSSLTSEKVAELQKEALEKEEELHKFRSTTASDLWKTDLERLAQHL